MQNINWSLTRYCLFVFPLLLIITGCSENHDEESEPSWETKLVGNWSFNGEETFITIANPIEMDNKIDVKIFKDVTSCEGYTMPISNMEFHGFELNNLYSYPCFELLEINYLFDNGSILLSSYIVFNENLMTFHLSFQTPEANFPNWGFGVGMERL